MAKDYYLVEIETSVLRTYKVRHMKEAEIRKRAEEFEAQMDPVEEHSQTRVKSLIEIPED